MSESAVRIEVEANDAVAEVMEELKQAIVYLIDNEPLQPPIHIATLASNGAGHIARFENTGEAIFLAEHEEEPGMRLPIHTILMDDSGNTARIIITGKRTVH